MKIYILTDEILDYTKDGKPIYIEQKELYLTGYVKGTYSYYFDEDGELTDSTGYITIYSDNKTEIAAYDIKHIVLLTIDDKILISSRKNEIF